uniref:thioesterase domain-containing protein n=1 Tax=Tenacibaculum halocynthiae TaxID=1254437 RepID=UPI003D647157
FISNPFGEGRLYKTGDLVRWLPEGDLEYLGRNDYQVKLRGYRVELGEIESELENIESISQSIVIALGSEENQQLIAYLCGERELDSNEVRLLLSSKLPDYMIPTSYVWLESFPVNANGKLDKKLLPTPDLTIGDEYVAPSNKTQEKLVSVWSEVLGIEEERISVISDFFTLGGHSLSAMKMKHEINKYFKVEILLSEVFLAPTIISLSSKIEEEEIKEKENLTIIPLNKRETEEKLFIIHDGSGEIDGYLELTRNIQGHQCYGIRFNNELSSLSLESIASMYIEEIKSIQKTGPYKLLGWSLGGVIATEMVLQLEKLNERVEKLIVIDSHFNYEKPLYKTSFNIDSELELLSSNFGFYSKKREKIRSLKNLYSEFMESDFYKQLPIEEIQDIIPQELKQLIPDFFNKDKNELFKATGKIRSLITASDNYWINRNVAANTLFIRPIKSSNTINIDELEKTFINLCIKNTSGDHFSIMKTIEAKILSTIVDNHLELTLV